MKIFLLGLSLILSINLQAQIKDSGPHPTERINRLLRFVANQSGGKEATIAALIMRRCQRYVSRAERGHCRNAVKKQIDILDFDIIFSRKDFLLPRDSWSPEAFVFIAFKDSLIKTLSDPQTKLYLDQLRLGLSDFSTGSNPNFNIWEFTLAHYKSPLKAARIIASLFQDTSLVKLHLAYLSRGPSRGAVFEANQERLSRAIDSINLILDYSEDNFRNLFYPPTLKEHLGRNLYHFYVPLYLAMALAHEGFSTYHAAMAPLMLTLTYEFITIAPDYRYLLYDPPFLDPRQSGPALSDIFASFQGASFGLGKKIDPKIYGHMREKFSHSTYDGVTFLLRNSSKLFSPQIAKERPLLH